MVLFFGQLMAHAQTTRFEATVVDAVTRVHLPFASVYVGPEASTITNLDGEFVIDCAPDAMLHISYVGYRAVHVKAAELKGVSSRFTVDDGTLCGDCARLISLLFIFRKFLYFLGNRGGCVL